MKRRHFLQLLSAAAASPGLLQAATQTCPSGEAECNQDQFIKDLLTRTRFPDRHHANDLFATDQQRPYLASALNRLGRLQRTVGFGNFNVISFDHGLKYSRRYSRIGEFTRRELAVLEEIFYVNAAEYGFLGEKPVDNLTSSIRQNDIVKVPRSGHFLYRGDAQSKFEQVQKEVGSSLVLTSGIRSVTKQMYLFLRKASKYDWNLSLASRSLAPPGYSFHGVGDFDVGKKGMGARNFSSAFAKTDEYKKLVDLGYIDIRYPLDNQLGVRFEPWHIKVVI